MVLKINTFHFLEFGFGSYIYVLAAITTSTNMQDKKLKILFVCTINRMRSATAHKIFETDSRFEVKSAGTDNSAAIVLSSELLEWADAIVVMEKHHRAFIRAKHSSYYNTKKIVCLYIPDEYDFMQPELIAILKDKVEDLYKRGLLGVPQ